MKLLRIAVVGIGTNESSRARAYLNVISRLKEYYTLCALCDQNKEKLNLVGKQFGVKALYTKLENMLVSEKPDVVFALVPTDGQSVIALTAARKGCNIITEIPYAITLEIGDAIAKVCEEKNVKWEIAENVWRWPNEKLKQKVVRPGIIGRITHIRLWYPCGSYHGFNAIRMILGREPQRVLGYAQLLKVPTYTNYGGQIQKDRWWESGLIEFPDNITCIYEMPPANGIRGSHWEIEGTEGYLSGNELKIFKNSNNNRYSIEDIYEEIDGQSVLAGVKLGTEPPITWDNPFKQLKISNYDDIAKASILLSMYQAVVEDIEPQYPKEKARRDMELWIALRESALKDNIWIPLPLKEETTLERRLHEEYISRYGYEPITDTPSLLERPFNRLSVMWDVAGWL